MVEAVFSACMYLSGNQFVPFGVAFNSPCQL